MKLPLLTILLLASTLMAQNFVSVVQFNGTNGGNPVYGPLVQGLDGNFYGTTQYGGNYSCGIDLGCGTIFRVNHSGKLTTIYTFCQQENCPDGANPWSGLLLATDGNFYGTTYLYGEGCPSTVLACGTVFRLTSQGKLTTLYTFCQLSDCADGASPSSALTEGNDGNFYGTTTVGGYNGCPSGCGTVFRITSGGVFTSLYAFYTGPGNDGNYPVGPLVQGLDGNFYGTASQGGNECLYGQNGCGIVFRVTPTGVETPLYFFCSEYFSCSDGGEPFGGLVLASDGNFYGTTAYNGAGTIFQITPPGALTTLYHFCGANCQTGAAPIGTLIQATDGALYGTTDEGGTGACNLSGCGTVFLFSHAGLKVLHSFQGTDGESPDSALTQSTDGFFVGATYQGAGNGKCFFQGCGSVFALTKHLSPFVAFIHNAASVGANAGVLGQGFIGTTSVELNGTSTQFKVVSDTVLTFTVPSNGTTGFVTAATPSRTLKSNVKFRVLR